TRTSPSATPPPVVLRTSIDGSSERRPPCHVDLRHSVSAILRRPRVLRGGSVDGHSVRRKRGVHAGARHAPTRRASTPGRVSVSLSLRLRCRTTSCRPARWPAWRRHTASSPLTCLSAHAENRLDRPACRGVRRGLVDLVEVVKGDQTIEGEAALHVQVQ